MDAPMKFCFCSNHQYACPKVSHCPHLGGASLGALVLAASDHDDHFRMVDGQLDFERQRNSTLVAENERLERELSLNQRFDFALILTVTVPLLSANSPQRSRHRK
jgi:hypothetical protein